MSMSNGWRDGWRELLGGLLETALDLTLHCACSIKRTVS
jgi:hypothetical protein